MKLGYLVDLEVVGVHSNARCVPVLCSCSCRWNWFTFHRTGILGISWSNGGQRQIAHGLAHTMAAHMYRHTPPLVQVQAAKGIQALVSVRAAHDSLNICTKPHCCPSNTPAWSIDIDFHSAVLLLGQMVAALFRFSSFGSLLLERISQACCRCRLHNKGWDISHPLPKEKLRFQTHQNAECNRWSTDKLS